MQLARFRAGHYHATDRVNAHIQFRKIGTRWYVEVTGEYCLRQPFHNRAYAIYAYEYNRDGETIPEFLFHPRTGKFADAYFKHPDDPQ